MIPPKEFLRKTVPFSYLKEEEIDELLNSMEIRAYEEGETIIPKNVIPPGIFYVYTGKVLLKNDHEEILSSGEIFPLTSVTSENEIFDAEAVALEDSILYVFNRKEILRIASKNENFRRFFQVFYEKRFSELSLDRVVEEVFLQPVSQLISRPPVTCPPECSVSKASEIMLKNRIGSVVVVKNGILKGIFTDTDLKKAVVLSEIESPVEKFMTQKLITSDIEEPVFEAYVKMIENGITHLIITKDGDLEGVISLKDILSMFEPFAKIIRLYAELKRASNIAEMKEIFNEIMGEIKVLAFKGMSFKDLSRMISSIYDWVYIKVIDFFTEEYSLKKDFSWVNMGSSGRREQIIATDQDNAIIVETEVPEDFLKDVNEAIDFIGIPKCQADYMASKWKYSIDEWKNMFKEWFSNPNPKNLRLLTVFLDMRHIYGNEKLYNELLDFVFEVKNKQTVRFLAVDSVNLEPPIGFFGIRDIDKGLDLKKHAIYPIVNGVRVFALDNDIRKTNTLERLFELEGVLGENRVEELKEAYEYIQNLRLRHQISRGDNLIAIDELEKLDIAILKESFKIIKNFQKFTKSYFGVERI